MKSWLIIVAIVCFGKNITQNQEWIKKNRSKYLRQIDMHDNTINRTFNKIWTRTWDTQGLMEKYKK